ncbi:hypothetical protein D3C81_2057690 [compost metagenome]
MDRLRVRASHPVHDEAGLQKGPVEGLAVVGHHKPETLQHSLQVAEHGKLLRRIADKQLIHNKRSALPIPQANHKCNIACSMT